MISTRTCGGASPIGWVVLNASWPRGTEPHLRRCDGCAECEPDDPRWSSEHAPLDRGGRCRGQERTPQDCNKDAAPRRRTP